MTLVPLRDSAAVVDVLVSDTSISSLQRRSGGMMTTSDSGRGRGVSSGSSGAPATTPNSTSDGKSHGVLVNVVVPVVFVVVVVAFGLLFLGWLLRRLRRSRGSGRVLWPLFEGLERRPQLFAVSLHMQETGQDGSWSTLQPASVDLISGEKRRRWKRGGHIDVGDVSTAASSRRVQGKKLHGEHRDFMTGDSSGKDAVEVRVTVLVAMPSPSRSIQMGFSDATATPLGPLEEGLFIGTAHASF
ncbi:hypothetical protein LXA43DRAFT_996523 [Ganoderma leucocontextum]|nr:hypothetical protein LXA43DRAFT_996523 [Ganoderma leucocontextum]